MRVLQALIPVAIGAVYFFGWRVAAILAISIMSAFLTEWSMVVQRNGKISIACFVTASLYALSLPPTVPFWIAAVGAVIAILFGKEVFGGFGKNIFNPAIVGRAFVYVAFPVEMTGSFVPAFSGIFGGFTRWSLLSSARIPEYLTGKGLAITDAVTAATPMWARRDFSHVADLAQLIVGNIHGIFTTHDKVRILAAGSAGEVSAVLITVAAIYLIATKTAQWRLMLATFCGAVVISVILRHLVGIDQVPPLTFSLFSGGFFYAAVFMVTDPVSAPKIPLSQWIYGIFIGSMIIFFRYKAVFAGGVAFAILLGNMVAPSLDLWLKQLNVQKRQRA